MSFFSKIVDSAKSVVRNVTQTVVNPVNTIKNAVLLGPISSQSGAAIFGPEHTLKQDAVATAVGAAVVAAGGLAAGGSPAATTSSANLGAGTLYGSGITAETANVAANTSLYDSAKNYFGLGKSLFSLFNPGVSDAGTGTTPANNGTTTATTFSWKWPLIIGGGLLVLWLILSRR